MPFEEHTGQVQNLSRLPSQGETTRASAAVLETLDRLPEAWMALFAASADGRLELPD